jgi:CRP-like cAMP-binding protein
MLLLVWCTESGIQTDDGIRLTVPLTEKDIGQMLGASRETIARLLGRFRDSHIAEHSGRVFLIRDKEALQGIATVQPHGATRRDQPRSAFAQM